MRKTSFVKSNTLSRRTFLASATSALAASCAGVPSRSQQSHKHPNVVFILADDFGVGDIQALYPSGKIPTPNLDALVRQSIRFTDAHTASAVCSPTRYGLLTGRYCWRTRLQNWVLDAYEQPLIAQDRLTLPKMLKSHGYTTACVGKWHLGWDWPGEGEGRDMKPDFSKPIKSGPTTRGFDYYFGTDVPNYPPFTFIENDRVVVQPTAANKADPSIHIGFDGAPMAPGWRFDQILPTLTDKATQYIHEHARKPDPFFLYFPMTSPHEPIVPTDQFKGKSGIAPIGDFLMETDWSAGQVLKALDDAGIAENTLVIFAGDNGHSSYTGWDDLIKSGHHPSGPYRGWKGQIWEGGHRVPLIVRWLGKIAPDTQSNQLICLNDMTATCAALLGEKLPDNAAEDSVNMLKALDARTKTPIREALVHHDVQGGFAIRQGPWKLVIVAAKEGDPRFELYNLDVDIAETNDVSKDNPDLVQRMTALLDSYVSRGRSTPGPTQCNDTGDIGVRHLPKQRWGRARTA